MSILCFLLGHLSTPWADILAHRELFILTNNFRILVVIASKRRLLDPVQHGALRPDEQQLDIRVRAGAVDRAAQIRKGRGCVDIAVRAGDERVQGLGVEDPDAGTLLIIALSVKERRNRKGLADTHRGGSS
jgi:hypothetical protein